MCVYLRSSAKKIQFSVFELVYLERQIELEILGQKNAIYIYHQNQYSQREQKKLESTCFSLLEIIREKNWSLTFQFFVLFVVH